MKVLATLAARLAQQGFAGHSIGFEAGFAPLELPPALYSFLLPEEVLRHAEAARFSRAASCLSCYAKHSFAQKFLLILFFSKKRMYTGKSYRMMMESRSGPTET